MAMIPSDADVAQIRSVMENDVFAAQTVGCAIVDGGPGFSLCSLEVRDSHRNAMGNIMGGAIFTLADYALSVAANYGNPPTMSISCSIDFMSVSRGSTLYARAELDKDGRTLSFGRVAITDDTGRLVARMTATCHKAGPALPA